MNDVKELQIQSPKGKKKHYSRIEYLCESIHPKKKIVSFKDLLCYDNQQKFKDKL